MTTDLNTVRLEDYRPYPFQLKATHLTFDIGADHTDVESTPVSYTHLTLPTTPYV